MFSQQLLDIVASGTSIKRDGAIRKWAEVVATGNYFIARDGSRMIEVREGSEQRSINLDTFSGQFGRVIYHQGRKVGQDVEEECVACLAVLGAPKEGGNLPDGCNECDVCKSVG